MARTLTFGLLCSVLTGCASLSAALPHPGGVSGPSIVSASWKPKKPTRTARTASAVPPRNWLTLASLEEAPLDKEAAGGTQPTGEPSPSLEIPSTPPDPPEITAHEVTPEEEPEAQEAPTPTIPSLGPRPLLQAASDGSHRSMALRLVNTPPLLEDDLLTDASLGDLCRQTKDEVAHYRQHPGSIGPFIFGAREVSTEDYLEGLALFAELACEAKNKTEFLRTVQGSFDFYEAYGYQKADKKTGTLLEDYGPGTVKFTVYRRVRVPGSLTPTKVYSQPIYRHPAELQYDSDSKLWYHWVRKKVRVGKKKGSFRWEKVKEPFYTRSDIDRRKVLKRNGKTVLCYIRPADAWDAHIEGSLTVDLGRGKELHLRTDGQNGHGFGGYPPLAKGAADKAGIRTREYLRTLPTKKFYALACYDKSYVFFRPGEDDTYVGLRAVPGRTIAADRRFFPKGGLAFIQARKPVFSSRNAKRPDHYEPYARLVKDQDTGGSIRGPGRIDVFWGDGAEAEQHADWGTSVGRLYYLAPKEKTLLTLRQVASKPTAQ